jgi:hypothetical protein
MTKKTQDVLFGLIPISFILLFVTSGEQIISIFESTKLANILYDLSFPNTIVFNLCIGYLSGVFIYILTAYIPNKEKEKKQNIITIRLLNQVTTSIESIYRTILKCSSEKYESMEEVDSDIFKIICKKCALNFIIGKKKILSENPIIYGDIIVREAIINDWNFIKYYLNEIDLASMYIDPKAYELSLKIKKCAFSVTVPMLSKNIENTNLDAWSSELYELYELKNKLEEFSNSLQE